jgi:hypothetical protein
MPNFDFQDFGKISYYKNVILDPGFLINLIERSDQDLTPESKIPKWTEWTASGDEPYVFGYQKRFKDNAESDLNSDVRRIVTILTMAIESASRDYGKRHEIEIGMLTPLSVSKYSTGKSMGPHVDDYGNDDDPNISVVLYLNDDYTGGELFFKEQNVKIKPEAGSIVIFPSVEPYYHESLPVESGTKYMSPGFWRKQKVV